MSDGPRDDGSSLDDVDEEEVERLEESVDTDALDEDEMVTLDDAARALLAKPPADTDRSPGCTGGDPVRLRRAAAHLVRHLDRHHRSRDHLYRGAGGLNLGIEFKGGSEWTIAAPGVTQTQAVDAMKGTGLIDPTVELLGSGSKQTLTVQSDINRLSQAQQDAVNKDVQKAMLELTAAHAPPSPSTTTTTTKSEGTTTTTTANGVPAPAADKVSVTTVGPTWGSSITDKAIQALIIFFIVVAVYISIRFEPKMALAAFIAMIHDVLVAVGIYSIFDFQVTPDTVVAILTILGYSLYDTVVVFDRVRDNTRGIGSSGRMTYPQLINLSMNQTLARSINTSMVAILPVLAVLLIGAQLLGATTLQAYGLALFVGLLSGAYSSIFIAAPVLCMMKVREDRWVTIANRLAKRGDTQGWYSAADAATMSTQMSVAAAGQQARAAAPPAPALGDDQAKRPDQARLGRRGIGRGTGTVRDGPSRRRPRGGGRRGRHEPAATRWPAPANAPREAQALRSGASGAYPGQMVALTRVSPRGDRRRGGGASCSPRSWPNSPATVPTRTRP